MITSQPFVPRIIEQIGLMRACFPRAKRYNTDYLSWLYSGNPLGHPVGVHFHDNGVLKGQVAGIRQNIILKHYPIKALLLLDVAIAPSLRGQGLFLRGVAETMELAASQGVTAIVGVANGNTYRGYEKLGFQNVTGLDAKISLLSDYEINAMEAIDYADYFQDWTDDTLKWRMSNPLNSLSVVGGSHDTLTIEGRTDYHGLAARAEIPVLCVTMKAPSNKAPAKPSVILSLHPSGTARHRAAFSIPERLKPSPLRLIYMNLDDKRDRLDPSAILFSFLDFDPF